MMIMSIYDLSEKRAKDFWPKEWQWTIDFIVPSVGEKVEPNEIFPEAHTHGLEKFDHKEIQVRFMNSYCSGFLLNLLAGWVAGGHGKLENGDTVIVPPLEIEVKEEKYSGHGNNQNIFRLSWDQDP